MSLHSLVLCADEKIVRTLRRVLSDLEIQVEQCLDADSAVRKLTRQRFEAVIVDCHNEEMAARVLRSVRSAACNKRAVAIAIIEAQSAIRSAFALGAHFVLYKPISSERAKSSFRAVRALMKCERRRNTRVAVEIPITLSSEAGSGQQRIVSTDISEGGLGVRLPRGARKNGALRVRFTLPGTEHVVECGAEVAWENQGSLQGLRFARLALEQRNQLKAWLARHSEEIETDDPPVQCKLTDLSLGGCYLETAAPFPARTKVLLTMEIAALSLQVEGVVRVMHPETGMGVEFTQTTNQQREHVERFIHALTKAKGALPELEVEPEGMDDVLDSEPPRQPENEDPLLDLFRRSAQFTSQEFQDELRRQRASHPEKAPALGASGEPHAAATAEA